MRWTSSIIKVHLYCLIVLLSRCLYCQMTIQTVMLSHHFILFCPLPSQIGKFDTETKEVIWWGEENCWPSEPVFVPRPNGESEDDGERSFFCRDSLADDNFPVRFKTLKLSRQLKLLSPSLFMCRCGFISRYQLQPGSEVLHRGYWWPNVQGSRSSLHGRRAAQGRARDFHPKCELVHFTPPATHETKWHWDGKRSGDCKLELSVKSYFS